VIQLLVIQDERKYTCHTVCHIVSIARGVSFSGAPLCDMPADAFIPQEFSQGMMEPSAFRLSHLSQWKMQVEYRQGASDFGRILGHASIYKHSLRCLVEAGRQVRLRRALRDKIDEVKEEEVEALPAESVTSRVWQPIEAGQCRSFVVHVMESVHRDHEHDRDDSDEDSDVEDAETSSEDEWDDPSGDETELVEWDDLTDEEIEQGEWDNSRDQQTDQVKHGPGKVIDRCMQRCSLLDDGDGDDVGSGHSQGILVSRELQSGTGKQTASLQRNISPELALRPQTPEDSIYQALLRGRRA